MTCDLVNNTSIYDEAAYVIQKGKIRAPAAAMALIERVKEST
jgi:hypothetical protein